jgi:ribonuclease HIII
MNDSPDAKASTSTFVTTVDTSMGPKLIADLIEQGFEIAKPQYTVFAAKKKGASCTLYTSGKMTVQGKDMGPFLEFYLEPTILQKFTYTYKDIDTNIVTQPHIGIDESGKGDFFGPLCVAGVFAGGDDIMALKNMGVRDSKTMTEGAIKKAAKAIMAKCAHQIVKINPAKYNELIVQFDNLNKLLAWGHATAIEQLVTKTNCPRVIIDQFANEHVVLTALKRKNLTLDLTQRHRGEEDLVVAAASILARYTFVTALEEFKKTYGMEFPKGASSKTIAAGKEFIREHGRDQLGAVAKLHFKTLDSIIPNRRE